MTDHPPRPKPESETPRELIEREAVLTALTIIMLPDHDYLFDQVESAILRLPARACAQQVREPVKPTRSQRKK